MNKHALHAALLLASSISLAAIAPGIAAADSPPATAGAWRGGILFDEDFRATMRLRSIGEQEIARTISDFTLVATMATAALDATLVPLVQGDVDLAWQAQFAHLFALGITLSAGEAVKRLAHRARPYERECESAPERPGCGTSDAFQSFYSLHSGVAFTSAGFSCSMHASRALYGDIGADAASCGASLALATVTGLLRVLSDRHYLSDVLVGAALGFLVGYLVPLAVVPSGPGPTAPTVSGQQIGLSISGAF